MKLTIFLIKNIKVLFFLFENKIKEKNPNDVPKLKKEGPTWMESIFEGKTMTVTRCGNCKTNSEREESYFDISLDIDYNSSLTHCLKKCFG